MIVLNKHSKIFLCAIISQRLLLAPSQKYILLNDNKRTTIIFTLVFLKLNRYVLDSIAVESKRLC